MEKRFVYADNAATTRVSENALKAMLPFLQESFGNPSSLYSVGRKAAAALLDARKKVAEGARRRHKGDLFYLLRVGG